MKNYRWTIRIASTGAALIAALAIFVIVVRVLGTPIAGIKPEAFVLTAMRTLLWESRLPAKQGEQLRKIPLYVVNTDCKLFGHYVKMLGGYYEVKDTYLGADAFERFVNDYVRD